NSVLLANAQLVNEGRIVAADVWVRGDRIERIGTGPTPAGTTTIDLAGKHLLPGLIDDQVHCREPGLTHKATLGTESLAALCGGVTSFLDMPNTQPPTTDRAALAEKRGIAAASCHVNYGFYLGATNTNLEEIKRVTQADACGVKVFMGASTGNMLVDDPQTLEGIFAECRVQIAAHCEYSPLIWENEKRARERYGDAVPIELHPEIRSAEACYRSSSMAVGLAKKHGARLHVLHLTTARELELFEPGPVAAKRITGEVCAHHLWFDESSYATLGTKIKCNPAIKTAADRAALRAAVVSDRIDVIATDHAPHTLEEKGRGYFEAPSGLPLVQHSLLMLLDQHAQGLFTLPKIVEKAAHNPAVLFGIADRGFIREGYYADLVAVDLSGVTRVDAAQVRYKCGWSPFEGTEFRGAVALTLLNGVTVFRDGQPLAVPRAARPLEFRPR
ncbi:MAG TPA: dihydroorotase, partial [Gammaproteobacteria bacterium]|nr:dihydroorotase [Gammaproteobacteria bacterium]